MLAGSIVFAVGALIGFILGILVGRKNRVKVDDIVAGSRLIAGKK